MQQGLDRAVAGREGASRDAAAIVYVRNTDTLAAGNARLAGMCHPAMHVLGRREGQNAAAADHAPTFPDAGATQLCTAGYVHGLAEGYLARSPHADVAVVFPKLCYLVSAQAGCAHGIGHALLRAQRSESANAAATAIAGCDTLPKHFPVDCVNGVYMELAMRTEPKPVPVASYMKMCRVADRAANPVLGPACWGYLGSSLASNNIATADEPGYCRQASVTGRSICFEGYGRDIGTKRIAHCETATGDALLAQSCIDGGVGLSVGSGHVSATKANAMCGQIRSHALQNYCSEAVVRYSKGRVQSEALGATSAPA
ncbi:MAG: hypothetical protein JWN41_287 [Thermoleophilia bacterium]|nr:hypothetical protein [Thermoleophilia bacterium]